MHKAGEFIFLISDKCGQLIADSANALTDYYAVLGEQSPGLIDQSRACLDVALPDAVNALNIRLLGRLVRHKAHVGPLYGLADGCRIVSIVFRAEQIRFYIPGMDTANFVSKTFNGSGPILRGRASIHAHEAGGRLAKKWTTEARLSVRLSTGLLLASTP